MGTSGIPNLPPIDIIERHGLTEVQVHCDVQFSEEQLASINTNLHEMGQPPIRNRKRRLRWATSREDGGYWEFHIETYTIADKQENSPTLHLQVGAHKLIRDVPTVHLRSTRTSWRIKTLVETLSQEKLASRFDCSLIWHSLPRAWLLPEILPLNARFPEGSVIQEISGVAGGSIDGTVKFVVDRISTNPIMFHVWLAFQYQQALTPKILTQVVSHGSSMLENINMWEN